MKAPLFTIATVSYNSSKWIFQAISSVLNSSFTDFEYLISDDNSSDSSWEIIKSFNDPRIKSWRNEQNLGEYPNRNKILNEANGEYILFVDADDILYKYTLRNLFEYVASFPTAGMIWGLNPQHFPFYVFPALVMPRECLNLIYRTNIPISIIGFGEILFKCSVLRNAGGFSTSYRTGDTFIKKLLSSSEPVLFVNIGFMFWRQSSDQASKKYTKGAEAFVERMRIDDVVLSQADLPVSKQELKIILRNLKISRIKLLLTTFLIRGDVKGFFYVLKHSKISLRDLPLLFDKGDYGFSPSNSLDNPIINNFHFENNS